MELELSTTDIEEFAVSAVKNEIQKHPECLKAYLDQNDRTPMWDGFISVYNNVKKRNKDWEYKFDIQIKGKKVKNFSKGKIKYSIDINILKNYQKAGTGTLFFVVQIINSQETKIFYKNLLPVDIKEILDKTEENQKSISVLFSPIVEKSPSSIKHVCLHFAQNSKLQQGKTIKNINELKNIKDIEIPLIVNQNENYEDFLFSENVDIYSYATLEDGQKFILPKLEKICKFQKKDATVTANGKIYYNTITYFTNATGTNILIGKSVTCYKNADTINIDFKLHGNLYERINDINFMLDTIYNNCFYINDTKLLNIDMNNSKGKSIENLKAELEKLEKLKILFEKYEINFNTDFSLLTTEDWKNIRIFQQINDGKYLKPNLDMELYYINISKYKIIILTQKNSTSFVAYNYFSNLKNIVRVFYFDEEQNEESMSPYVNLSEEDLLTSSNFNANVVKQSFQELNLVL